jgi:hypothetical protein
MMYESKLAVALKSAGKVLREFKDTVYVPFGSEYSIFIKNMNSVRALVSVSVDGEDVGDGTQFIVDANDNIDIERFIKNGNFNKGNRLKFIERNDAVEDHRGIGVEDGLVRVEFQFERIIPTYVPPYVEPWKPNDTTIWYNYTSDSTASPLRNRTTFTSSASSDLVGKASDSINVSNSVQASINDAGITVPGSESNQQFRQGDWFPLESETHVIVLKMLGQTEDNTPVRKAVTVKSKPKCITCNHINKATAKFCSECGTSLKIV